MSENTVDIYFAVDDKMIETYAKQDSSSFWILNSNSFLAFFIGNSAGDVMNAIQDCVEKPYTICQAKVSKTDLVDAFRAALVGDVVRNVQVNIVEMTRVA